MKVTTLVPEEEMKHVLKIRTMEGAIHQYMYMQLLHLHNPPQHSLRWVAQELQEQPGQGMAGILWVFQTFKYIASSVYADRYQADRHGRALMAFRAFQGLTALPGCHRLYFSRE